MRPTNVLLLNADFTPEKLISWQTAMVQVVTASKNSAYVVEEYKDWKVTDSKGRSYCVPAVMALRNYVKIGDRKCPYTKGNIYARDLMICQYCEQRFSRGDLTVDHVIPSSRWKKIVGEGTASTFENVVTCCKRCNSVKGDKTPDEAGMYLMKQPRAITRREAFRNRVALMRNIPNEWKPYLTGIMCESI